MKSTDPLATGNGRLAAKVFEFERILGELVQAAKEPGFTPADWAPLAELVAVDEFERRGTAGELKNWQEYTEWLTKWASTRGLEVILRRISELPGLVYHESERRQAGNEDVIAFSSMGVFEFNEEGKIRHIDVYMQGQREPSPAQGSQ